MAEIKDKVVTVESLSVLHEHNKNTYMPVVNPVGSGMMTIDGDGDFSGNINANSITIGTNIRLVPSEDGLKIEFLNQETTEEEISNEDESSSDGEVTDETEIEEEIIEES